MRILNLAWMALFVAISASTAAATETVLYSFSDANTSYPKGRLYLHDGVLFGTASGDGVSGPGQVFALRKAANRWKLRTLLAFNKANGSSPRAGLTADSTGALYGTTANGGTYGYGTIFRLQKSHGEWTSSTIWSIGQDIAEGVHPECDILIDKQGALYGVAPYGGTGLNGTAFRLSQSGGNWTYEVFHTFNNVTDGYLPQAGLYMDEQGVLYGTTGRGGASEFGIAYTLTQSGDSWTEKIIHEFEGGPDGAYVWSGLVPGPKDTLYGATLSDGAFDAGTIFRLSPLTDSWKHSVVYDFGASGADGGQAYATLLHASDGAFYGATIVGGAHGGGTVFRLRHEKGGWTFKVLHDFGVTFDGVNPYGTPVMDADGNLYGTTFHGGLKNFGTIWKITPDD